MTAFVSRTSLDQVARNNRALTDEQLLRYAPSIFATEPWSEMSDRYTFIPTIDVVHKLKDEGFLPFSAVQSRTRIEGKGEFTKHMIRFRDVRTMERTAQGTRTLGTIYPEIVVTNAHDGGSAYKIDGGLFRLVCLNGMMVGESYASLQARHSGKADGVIEASYEIVKQFPQILGQVEEFNGVRLTQEERVLFAQAALELRYEPTEDHQAPVVARQIAAPRRAEDTAPSLWNSFNVAQEHLVQGGVQGRTATNRRMTTRPVTGIAENTKLNRALWTLAEGMAKLKAAA